MKAVVIALATIVALTAPAYSQGRGKGGGRHAPSQEQTEEQKKKAAEAEKAYHSALDKIPTRSSTPGAMCVDEAGIVLPGARRRAAHTAIRRAAAHFPERPER